MYGAALLSPPEQSTRTIYKAATASWPSSSCSLPVFTSAQDVESVLALAGYGTLQRAHLDASGGDLVELPTLFHRGVQHRWGMVTLGVLLGSIAGNIVDRSPRSRLNS